MDLRILIAVVFGLVVVAFGGFYYALGPHTTDLPLPPAPTAPPPVAALPADVAPQPPPPQPPSPPPPPMATPESIEAEIALSEHAELLALLKQNFNAEYNGLIAAPGTPNAQTTPSFSRIRTAASIARIFAMVTALLSVLL